MNKFIVTGTGRCGTGFLWRLFRKCNIFVEHENFFNPFSKDPKVEDFLAKDYVADISWMAAPFLSEFKEFKVVADTVVQPRDPTLCAKGLNVTVGFYPQTAAFWLM